MQGIYKIENTNNGKVYIGRSKNIEERWKQHKRMLENGTHHSVKLQRAYNMLKDKSVLQFSVVEEVKDEAMLPAREQYWADYHDAYNNGYGCAENVDNPKYTLKNQKKAKNKRQIEEDYEIFDFYYNRYQNSIDMSFSFKNKILLKYYKHDVMYLINKAIILCSDYLERDGIRLSIIPDCNGYNNLLIKLQYKENVIIEGELLEVENNPIFDGIKFANEEY